MVTTSYKGSTGSAFNLSSIDFVLRTAMIMGKRISEQFAGSVKQRLCQYDKPVLQAELGINWQNGISSYRADPNGYSIRQGLWAGIMGGGGRRHELVVGQPDTSL